MVLASDAVLTGGELIGDPTEGALVALAAKGGVDAVSTRELYPRIAELPFDAAYKLMATFHKMPGESGKEVVRCFVKGAPDQLLARAATVYDAGHCAPAGSAATGRRVQRGAACSRSRTACLPATTAWSSSSQTMVPGAAAGTPECPCRRRAGPPDESRH